MLVSFKKKKKLHHLLQYRGQGMVSSSSDLLSALVNSNRLSISRYELSNCKAQQNRYYTIS